MKYPLLLQEPWINESIVSTIDSEITYTNSRIKTDFIVNNKCSIGTCIIRIYQFLRITKDGGITAIGNDSTHKVLLKFSFEAVKLFEKVYRQRITYNMVETLILINRANLKFINSIELYRDFDNFRSKFDVAIIEITHCTIFNRDQMGLQVKLENLLRFIYDEEHYKRKCAPRDKDYEEYPDIYDQEV